MPPRLPTSTRARGQRPSPPRAPGTPVVASDLGPFPEIVDRPEVGRLFAGDAPEVLAQALLESFELAQAKETRAECRARADAFSTERTVVGYEDLYAELLSAG